MRRFLSAGLVTAFVALVGAPNTIHAQGNCPEGKTAAGQCVNAALAEALRQNAIIFSQSKISQTHYPILPVDDPRYRYPNGLIPDPLKPSAVGTPLPPPSP
jgi:hypothetical protein